MLTVQDASKNPTAYLVQLFFTFWASLWLMAPLSTKRTVPSQIAPTTASSIDAAEGRGIYDDIIVFHAQHLQHILKASPPRSSLGLGGIGPAKIISKC